MASHLGLVVGLCLSAFPAQAMRLLCSERVANVKERVPQLVEMSGRHHDTRYVLQAWPRTRKNEEATASDDPRNYGSLAAAEDLAEQIVSYGRDERAFPTTPQRASSLQFALGWLLAELINNAAYHGNQGDEATQVQIRLQLEGDRAIVRLSDRGTFFDVAPFSVEPDFEAMFADYNAVDAGGNLGIRLVLPGYVLLYQFRVYSEPRDDGDGVARTDVVVEVPLEAALKPKPEPVAAAD